MKQKFSAFCFIACRPWRHGQPILGESPIQYGMLHTIYNVQEFNLVDLLYIAVSRKTRIEGILLVG